MVLKFEVAGRFGFGGCGFSPWGLVVRDGTGAGARPVVVVVSIAEELKLLPIRAVHDGEIAVRVESSTATLTGTLDSPILPGSRLWIGTQ
jgi:hypothetical protein